MSEESSAIKERLTKFLKSKGLKFAEVERTANLANGFLRNTKGEIGASKLRNILMAYPDLNVNWLLTGIGSMLVPRGGDLNQYGSNAKGVKDGNMTIIEKQVLEEQFQDFDILDVNIEELPQTLRREIVKARQWHSNLQEAEEDSSRLKAENESLKLRYDKLVEKYEAEKEAKDEAVSELLSIYRKQANK